METKAKANLILVISIFMHIYAKEKVVINFSINKFMKPFSVRMNFVLSLSEIYFHLGDAQFVLVQMKINIKIVFCRCHGFRGKLIKRVKSLFNFETSSK